MLGYVLKVFFDVNGWKSIENEKEEWKIGECLAMNPYRLFLLFKLSVFHILEFANTVLIARFWYHLLC